MSTVEAVLDPQSKLNVAVDRPRTPQRRRVSQRLRRSREEQAMQATSKPQQGPSRCRRGGEPAVPSRRSGPTMSRPLNASQEPEGLVYLTKRGRISKAKKGVKDYHHCGCGKVSMRAVSLVGARLVTSRALLRAIRVWAFLSLAPRQSTFERASLLRVCFGPRCECYT